MRSEAVKKAIDDGCENINAVIIDGGADLHPADGERHGEPRKVLRRRRHPAADRAGLLGRGGPGHDRRRLCDQHHLRDAVHHLEHRLDAVGHGRRQYGPQGNLNEVSAAGNEEATNGNIIVGMYPDISTGPWAEYRVALEEAGLDTSELDYNSLGGMGTWAAYVGFTQIAETIEGDITAESFYEAASTTTALDLNGMVPVLDFTQEWTDGLEGYQRLFNRSVVYSQLEDGKVVPLTTEFEDVGDLAPRRPILTSDDRWVFKG